MDGNTSAIYAPIDVHPDAEDLVSSAVDRIACAPQVRLAVACEPDLALVNARLATFLSRRVKHPYMHMPLLHVCLKQASFQLASAVEHDRCPRQYLASVIHTAAHVLRYEIRDQRGRWHPLEGPPLMHWMQEAVRPEFIANPEPPRPLISMARFEHRLGRCLAGDLEIGMPETNRREALAGS